MKTPEEWHIVKHLGDFVTCGYCIKVKTRCPTKISFTTWWEADEWATEFNESTRYIDPLQPYTCRWCLQWHMGHPKGNVQRKRLERKRRKWLMEQRMKGINNGSAN